MHRLSRLRLLLALAALMMPACASTSPNSTVQAHALAPITQEEIAKITAFWK